MFQTHHTIIPVGAILRAGMVHQVSLEAGNLWGMLDQPLLVICPSPTSFSDAPIFWVMCLEAGTGTRYM